MSVPDEVSEWIAAYREWTVTNQAILTVVFDWFLEKAEWPSVENLRRELFRQRRRGIEFDLDNALRTRPGRPGQVVPTQWDTFVLSMRDLVTIGRAGALTYLVVRATQLALVAYESDEEPPAVCRHDFGQLPLTPGTAAWLPRLPYLITLEPSSPFGGGTFNDDWHVLVNKELVVFFEGVSSPDEYLDTQAAVIRRYAHLNDRAPSPESRRTHRNPAELTEPS
jgi:hypothetical protein